MDMSDYRFDRVSSACLERLDAPEKPEARLLSEPSVPCSEPSLLRYKLDICLYVLRDHFCGSSRRERKRYAVPTHHIRLLLHAVLFPHLHYSFVRGSY